MALLIADGFYEWQKQPAAKSRCTSRPDRQPFGFAGCTRRTEPESGRACHVHDVTGPANEFMASIHERMPIILPPDAYDLWLTAGDEHGTRAGAARCIPPTRCGVSGFDAGQHTRQHDPSLIEMYS